MEIFREPPGNTQTSFIVKRNKLRDYHVMSEDQQKWLKIHSTSGVPGVSSKSECTLELKTLGHPAQGLVSWTVCSPGLQVFRLKDYKEDESDLSNYSEDDLFNFHEKEHSRVKIRWLFRCEAKFKDGDGKEFASLKLKLKGKTSGKMEKADDYASQTGMQVKTLLKQVYYKLDWKDKGIQSRYVNSTHPTSATQWSRMWDCDELFKAAYVAKWGVDEATIQTQDKCDACQVLAVAFTMAHWFHPLQFYEHIETSLMDETRRLLTAAP